MEMWVVIGGLAAVVVLFGAALWAIDVRRERQHGSNSHWHNPVDPADNAGGASGQTFSLGDGSGG
ncbi:hypothetical protein [Streptomyces sp. V1I6]|uniref:hypothetical protein n=1 Tax=Streptomyces sp. V1I6 TaxID=3042273 RepID=UPI00278770B2|nr:hypothetical protein [Streptomyces sp. V1I6]MDQ0846121.1 hypothetical protein [Streptomyces sp. V1I6]